MSNTTAYAIAVAGARLAEKEGNDLTFANLREANIPVEAEYNRMTNPLSTLFHNLLLVRDGDRERVDYRTVTHFDAELLGLIGVKYVLLKKSQPQADGLKIAVDQPVSSRPEVGLFELRSSNHGQYSPTILKYSENVVEVFDIFTSKEFNPRRQAIVHSSIDSKNLVEADEVSIKRIRNGLSVKAKSKGVSFIILPFEFSNCLKIESPNSLEPKSISRADLFLTGVLFDRETEFNLNFIFGAFENQDCRLKDLADVRGLKVNMESLRTLREKYPSKLKLEGFQ
jgi:hypothetical protein